jgi:hypothetical protein
MISNARWLSAAVPLLPMTWAEMSFTPPDHCRHRAGG